MSVYEITVADILTSSGKFPMRPVDHPPPAEHIENAKQLAQRVTALLAMFGHTRRVTSGYRPAAVNAATPGAAKKSNHIICAAADLEDHNGMLGEFCMAHLDYLADVGLWLEHPVDTFVRNKDGSFARWCHLQIFPPRSKSRVFRA